MQLNGAIDRDLFGVDFKAEIFTSDERELDSRDCLSFAVQNLGNVPVLLDGNISIGVGECNTINFPNYGVLDYVRNVDVQWLTDGVADPDARIRVIRTFIVRKQPKTQV